MIFEKGKTYTPEYTELAQVQSIGDFKFVQGGCCDGEYYYTTLLKFVKEDQRQNLSYILKYDMKTWELVKISEAMPLDHGNDMCFNPKTEKLYVVNNNPSANIITEIDRETLKEVGRTRLEVFIYSMSYDAVRDRYIAGISGCEDLAILDSSFKVIGKIKGEVTGCIKQGNECDGKYIYMLYHLVNMLMVYTCDGEFVTRIELNLPPRNEPEHLSFVGDGFIIGTNGMKNIFRMTLK